MVCRHTKHKSSGYLLSNCVILLATFVFTVFLSLPSSLKLLKLISANPVIYACTVASDEATYACHVMIKSHGYWIILH